MSPSTLEKGTFIEHMSQDDLLRACCVSSVHLKENYFYNFLEKALAQLLPAKAGRLDNACKAD